MSNSCKHNYVVRHPKMFGYSIVVCELCDEFSTNDCDIHEYEVSVPKAGMFGSIIRYCKNGGHAPFGVSCNSHKFFVTFPEANWGSPIIVCKNCGLTPDELTASGETPYVDCGLEETIGDK